MALKLLWLRICKANCPRLDIFYKSVLFTYAMENISIKLHFVEVWMWYTPICHWVLGIKCIYTQIIWSILGADMIVRRLLQCSLILILCLWFRASLIYINNCPTRCNTKQSIYYSASSLYRFRVSITPIIRSTQNCNYSLRYWSFLCNYPPPTWPSYLPPKWPRQLGRVIGR